MKIAIIGAGCAGLVGARYCLKNNLTCDVYEQTDKIGGVWNYNDETGSTDQNGLPIHTVMYKDLRTNLPKELMSYCDFPYPENLRSFLTQPQVLSYMHRYVDHFKLTPLIKFYKQVVDVTPVSGGKWKLTILDVKSKVKETIDTEYDGVMVCNGHYHKVYIPEIDGMDTFVGLQIHSNVYRSPERFKGLRVLVIGAGPSGIDIASKIATVAQKVFISHRFKFVVRVSSSVVEKQVVKTISGNDVTFQDDTKETVDAIVYCTGYKYDFPFLSKECGIVCDGNWIKYLYKHIINVEHPTMGFLGVCNQICPFIVCDVQAQYFIATLTGRTTLKSKTEMIREIEEKLQRQGARGKVIHRIAEEQKNYCDDLAKMARFSAMPQVYQDLYVYVMNHRNTDDCFKIVDDFNFLKIEC